MLRDMGYSLPNERVEVRKTVDSYKLFGGRIVDQMPVLLAEGRSPLWTARFMRRRIDHSDTLPDLKGYSHTDFVAYDLSSRGNNIKFVLAVDKNGRVTEQGRKVFELVNPTAPLVGGLLKLDGEIYDSLPGIAVPRMALRVLDRDLKEDEILDSKLWRILARHPDEVPSEFAEERDLLKKYACWVKGRTKCDNNMGIYLNGSSNFAKLGALCVGGLGGRSGLDGGDDLGIGNGRLVGYLVPEAHTSDGVTSS